MTTTITAKIAQRQQQHQQHQQQQQQQHQPTSSMNGFRITGYPAAATPPARSNPIYAKPNAHELDLHISESLLYPGSTTQQQQALQSSPGPPPQLTSMLPSSGLPGAAQPIALKGNNPFLNSPSPTEAAPGVPTGLSSAQPATSASSGNYEMPEYAEPSRLRGLKQRPHSIAVGGSPAQSSFVDYNAQQQQRLLQLSRQQQQLRNAVTAAASTANGGDKETLYAALFQQYRQSPTNGQPAPPVPLHRKPAAAPVVPRRSQSTPRPPLQQQQQQQQAGINGQINGNGNQRPRSLDRFNGGLQSEAPPIPLRRFPNGNGNNNNGTLSRQRSPKKSSSADNMLMSPAGSQVNTMRHSISFHGGQETENGSKAEQTRPMSYAAPAPDQAYLEHQLRAYSEQLRTITESVRKYSEQAKLLSELKRQQQLAKQSQTNLNLLTPTTCNNSTGSNGNNNFQPNMISPEIVSKSLASLSTSQANEAQTPSNQLRLFLDNIRSSMRQEYQQHMPDDVLKPTSTLKRNGTDSLVTSNTAAKPEVEATPTPSDQLRQFLDAIRANKIPESVDKPKMTSSQTLDSFISKPLQMPDVTSGTPGGGVVGGQATSGGVAVNGQTNGIPTRRRPKSSIIPSSSNGKLEQREHSLVTSESFHQISDNLRLMSEDLQALSPSKAIPSSASSNSLKSLAANGGSSLTTELRVITSSPYSTSPKLQQMVMSKSNSSLGSVTTPSSATTTPSTAPMITDFNEILDSFQAMADKYKSKGSYDYLRKCSEALRQHSLQLKLQQQHQAHQQQQLPAHQQQQQQQIQNGFASDDNSSSCSTTPGSIREAVQNLLLQPRNGFQILDDRMRLFIDIIDSQDRLSQVGLMVLLIEYYSFLAFPIRNKVVLTRL